ncbi:unnamed protein product [Effrenium voratum]|nr:unnamed protein product [Effrenium voratum]
MLLCYVIGVLGLQWGVMGFRCFQNPTKACFCKLIHLDTVATRLTLPEDQQRTWKTHHFIRTVAEDIPQAILQTIYICSISRNFFMILSVCTAVGGSLLAFRDAINRGLVAAGFKKSLTKVKAVYVVSRETIHLR